MLGVGLMASQLNRCATLVFARDHETLGAGGSCYGVEAVDELPVIVKVVNVMPMINVFCCTGAS
jgi:hypothetical protein